MGGFKLRIERIEWICRNDSVGREVMAKPMLAHAEE